MSLIIHDPITFLDVREEDGCMWENNPPPTTDSPHSHPTVGFQFHAMGERHPGVQSSCEENKRIFSGSKCNNNARHLNATVVLLSAFNVFKTWNRLSSFYCIVEPSRGQRLLYSNTHQSAMATSKILTPLPQNFSTQTFTPFFRETGSISSGTKRSQ